MDRQDQISSLVWLAAGLFIVIGSIVSLDMGTFREPGAGLFPLITGSLLSFLSALFLFRTILTKRAEKRSLGELWEGTYWPRVIYATGALLIYTFLLKTVGFLLMTLLLLIFLFRGMEPQKWRLAIGLSILAAAGSYVIFDRVLQVSLPKGFLGF